MHETRPLRIHTDLPRSARRRLLALAAAALLLVASFSLVMVVVPAADTPRRVDVIFLIGPVVPTGMALAQRMLDDGLSDNLMLSRSGPFTPLFDVCTERHTYAVFCGTPDPFTTQGEARYLRDLSELHGWQSAAVITGTTHVNRTRILMSRCSSGAVLMIADTATLSIRDWFAEYVYQNAALVKVVLNPQC